jgi:hypothetical protein
MSFRSKHKVLRTLRGDDGKVMQFCGSSGLLVSCTPFQTVVYLVRVSLQYHFGMTPPVVALAHIIHLIQPFPQQKQSLARIALLLVMCVLPGLSRYLLSAIVIAIVAFTSWGGSS